MNARFVRTVHTSDEFGGASPDTIVVTIVPELAGKIREWAGYVRRTGAFTLQIFHPTPSWYERNWEGGVEDESILGDLFAPLETVLLVVSKDAFWWTACIPGTPVQLVTDSISIDEL